MADDSTVTLIELDLCLGVVKNKPRKYGMIFYTTAAMYLDCAKYSI